MDAGIWFEQRLLIDVFENRAIARPHARECIAKQILLPIADRSDAVDEHETTHARADHARSQASRDRRPTNGRGHPSVPSPSASRIAGRSPASCSMRAARAPGGDCEAPRPR